MIITNGIFLIDCENKILICHPTGSAEDVWSIPKGLAENNEEHFNAAKRELLEETGRNIENYEYISEYIGDCIYTHNRKKLRATVCKIKGKIKEIPLCESMVTDRKGNPLFPEIDKFAWVNIEDSFDKIHASQKELLKKYYVKNRISN